MSNLLDRRFLNISIIIQAIANEPDDNPTEGTQYIVGADPSGAFADASVNSIARFDGSIWTFSAPKAGTLEVLNLSNGQFLSFDGENWNSAFALGSDSPLLVVDDIIYGYHDPEDNSMQLSPQSVKDFRGRPYLYQLFSDELKLHLDNFFSENSIDDDALSLHFENGVYAGFGDGKVYTVSYVNGTTQPYISSRESLSNGQFVYNKADASLYSYIASKHSFLKVGGKRTFVVDKIVDYLGYNIPANLEVDGTRFLDIGVKDYENKTKLFYYHTACDNQVRANGGIYLASGTRLLALQSSLNDDACIFSIVTNGGNYQGVRGISELYNGDIIYCKFDGCTYTFSDNGSAKSLVKISTSEIAPVLDILHFAHAYIDMSSQKYAYTGEEFDKYIFYTGLISPQAEHEYNKLITKLSNSAYQSAHINTGDRYASLDDHRIYDFGLDGDFSPVDIPVGATFLNKSDNIFYLYDGNNFLPVNNNGAASTSSSKYVTETHVLAEGEILAKKFSLTNSIVSGEENNVLLFVSGVAQSAGIDFTASGYNISWENKGLDEVDFRAGDSFIIHYTKA